jgi:uncharacterized protein with HEPN domain
MNRRSQRLSDYLAHILEAIKYIDLYTEGMDEQTFLTTRLVQDAVIRNFEIIGEASNNIAKRYPEFVATHPELALTSAYEMRNAIAHGYFEVDFDVIWKTIQHDLPGFRTQIQQARAAMTGDQNLELPP